MLLAPDFIPVKQTAEYNPATKHLWQILKTANLTWRQKERAGKEISGNRSHNQAHADQRQDPIIASFRPLTAAVHAEGQDEYYHDSRVQKDNAQRAQFPQRLQRAVIGNTQACGIKVAQQNRQVRKNLVVRPEIARPHTQNRAFEPQPDGVLPDNEAIGIG